MRMGTRQTVPMSGTIQEKIAELEKRFAAYATSEARYDAVMEAGRHLQPFNPAWKVESNLISGCQSILYLRSHFENGKLFFWAYSEALISAGLAALLISVYSGATPEEILTTPPLFLQKIGVLGSLSPGRSNGLAHLHARMKQEALKCLQKQ